MSRLIGVITAIGLVVWTGLAWLGHALIDWGSALVASGAVALPVTGEAASWLSASALILGNISETVVIIIWALGAGLIVAAAAIAKRLLARRPAYSVPFKSGAN